LESTFSPAELHWKRRIALAALTGATKTNSEVCSNELSTVTESTVPIIVDEGFESENSELDHHTSDNTISEHLSVVNYYVDIPDVINVGVDIPTNKTCGELPEWLTGLTSLEYKQKKLNIRVTPQTHSITTK